MFSSKHFHGLEIEKNESASILWVPPARMCVRSLLLKGCKSCAAPLDVEIWAIVRPPDLGRRVFTPYCRNFWSIIRATSKTIPQAGLQDKRNYLCPLAGVEIEECAAIVDEMSNQPTLNLRSMPLLSKKYQINKRKSRASPTQTWIAFGTLLATSFTVLHCTN